MRLKIRELIIFCVGTVACACNGNVTKAPEITWSLMHPTPLDTIYMQRIIEESATHPVDNFEVCGGCNSGCEGSLDGLLYFEEYPLASQCQNKDVVASNQANIRRIVEMSHEAGKQVYYWHREVLCNDGLVKSIPGLLDADGEFDLLGKAYEDLLRYKIRKTFELVPDLDGIVLTLTEASFSALHNSRPDVYPPEKVVEKIGGIFASELQSRGKRFILRSFGSIKEDYDVILAGAQALSKQYKFEVETKITPFDFNPFLPDNPFLTSPKGCTLGAECDVLGEFLGCGRMVAEQVDEIVRYVEYARECKVDRFTIRLDRKWKSVFDVYPINLYAYEQAILHPGITAEQIRHDWYASQYPAELADTLALMSKEGMECVKKTEFIAGNMIFHWYPTTPDLKLLKAGGIFDVFASEGNLSRGCKQWAILSDNEVPGRKAIMEEKDQAVELAERNMQRLEGLSLSWRDSLRLYQGWSTSVVESRSVRELCRVTCAYFDDMEKRDPKASALTSAINIMKSELKGTDLLRPIPGMCGKILEEYPMELAMRSSLDNEALDYVLPGSISDQHRVEHYMHGSYCAVENGKIVAIVGNPVFPDAYLATGLKGSEEAVVIIIKGQGLCELTVNGKVRTIRLQDSEPVWAEASVGGYELSLKKVSGEEYPVIESIASYDAKSFFCNRLDKSCEQSLLMYSRLKSMPGLLADRTDRQGAFLPAFPYQWTSGFFPGTLWYLYAYSARQDIKDAAAQMTQRLEQQQYNTDTHDIGFMMNCSYGAAYKATSDTLYSKVLLQSAQSLSKRYDSTVGCIRSWEPKNGWDYIVIIDNMMNLELLMDASEISQNKDFSQIAISHADKTDKNHFRADGSCFHVVNYDSVGGKVISQNTCQGLADGSAWSRGQGWAVYGYTMMYRETGEKRYLNRAIKSARYILDQPQTPDDGVVFWDYDAPDAKDSFECRDGLEIPRDASAAAVIASAFIELSTYVKDKSFAKELVEYAARALASLSGPNYFAAVGDNNLFILKHSTINRPKDNYDTAVVYADYYYIEALLRYLSL